MNIDFFWDPVCPFCWVTSRWVVDIAPDRDIDITWRFISLRLINDGTYDDKPAGYEQSHSKGRDLQRVTAAVRHDHGNAPIGELISVIGDAIWNVPPPTEGDRRDHIAAFDQTKIEGLLTAAGLDASYAAAMSDESHDVLIQSETDLAFERTGKDVGTPIITYGEDGPSYFGPVISAVPDHESGLQLWDGLVALTKVATFSELKRSNRDPLDLPILGGN